ncbi:MAG: HNH endonuclease [Alistipes senegalensis]|nr:HNH endonuclease [Muribaculaceae bacterium]MCM1352373.1 HNH endonuclease [Alistipes senegalensis]
MQCIFCHKDASASTSVEHIVPESLGNKHIYLPKGYVCNACNHYFAIKIEKDLLNQPYFISLRSRNEILSKKNRLIKQDMIFPGAQKKAGVSFLTQGNTLLIHIDDKDVINSIIEGKSHRMIAKYLPEPEYPNPLMSRFLAKCAYEYFLFHMGKEKYDLCVNELLGQNTDILKTLREYARFGKGKYWQYSQRRIYSEGSFFIQESKDIPYEILHEMSFFVKDYIKHPNNVVEAEIYYVLVISGIEYAISISDPDISEYITLIQEKEFFPLQRKDEKILPLSKADFNPMFIKKGQKLK